MVHAVTDWLARGWNGDGPLVLTDTIVVVPTSQAGRRLREALAAYAAQKRQAVFTPRVLMPEQLTSLDTQSEGVASRTELLLAWTETLRAADLDTVREVLPLDPPERNFAWAARLARELIRLQATLAENGLRMVNVVERAGVSSAHWRPPAKLRLRRMACVIRRW